MKHMTFKKNLLAMAMALGLLVATVHTVQADAQNTVAGNSGSNSSAPLELPDKMQTVTGSFEGQTENPLYYSFKAIRGQNVLYWVEDPNANVGVKYEYQANNQWFSLQNPYIFHSLNPGDSVTVRVSKIAPEAKFEFRLGSAPYSAMADLITTDAHHLPHFGNAFQAFRKFDWAVALRDSTGHPVEGAKTRLHISKDDTEGNITTDAEGKGSATIELPGCQPAIWSPVYTRPIGPFQYRWVLRYNTHRLTTSIENNPTGPYWKETGLDNVFGHVCQEWLAG